MSLFPNNAKDTAKRPSPVTPVAIIGFYDPSTPDNAGPTPLPVAIVSGGGGAAVPITGDMAASGDSPAFSAVAGKPIRLRLSGTWAGTVTVLRSIDGGMTKLPLTAAGSPWAVYTANCNEIFAEEHEAGVQYYLRFDRTSGTLEYRVS